MSGDRQIVDVIGWLNKAAIALAGASESTSESELNALHRSLTGVRVAGFADPTHGTREFYQTRQRYLQLLVKELGFRALAIEGGYAAAAMLNRYVVQGVGDPEAAVQNLGAVMWNVREFIATVEWLRDWNRDVAPEQTVQIFGLDIWPTAESRRVVLEYLGAVAPSLYQSAARVFEQVASAEQLGLIHAWRAVTKELYLELRALLTWLEDAGTETMHRTSLSRYQEAMQHVRLISRWLAVNLSHLDNVDLPPDLPRVSGLNPLARSRYMAENLLFLMERRAPGAKVVVWAHMFHLGVGIDDPQSGQLANMGSILRARWQDEYYVFGFECNGGAYLARELLPADVPGELRRVPIPESPAQSLPWYLGQASAERFLVELRDRDCPDTVHTWLNTPRLAHAMGWLCGDPPHLYQQLRLGGFYDALIFFRLTQPTTPTASARRDLLNNATH